MPLCNYCWCCFWKCEVAQLFLWGKMGHRTGESLEEEGRRGQIQSWKNQLLMIEWLLQNWCKISWLPMIYTHMLWQGSTTEEKWEKLGNLMGGEVWQAPCWLYGRPRLKKMQAPGYLALGKGKHVGLAQYLFLVKCCFPHSHSKDADNVGWAL